MLRVLFAGLLMLGLAACVAQQTMTMDGSVSRSQNNETSTIDAEAENTTVETETGLFEQRRNLPFDITLVMPVDPEFFTMPMTCVPVEDAFVRNVGSTLEYGSLSNKIVQDLIESQFRSVKIVHATAEEIDDFAKYDMLPENWQGSDLFVMAYSTIFPNAERWNQTPVCYFPFDAKMKVRIFDNSGQQEVYTKVIEIPLEVDGRGGGVFFGAVGKSVMKDGVPKVQKFLTKASRSIYNAMQSDKSLVPNLARVVNATMPTDPAVAQAGDSVQGAETPVMPVASNDNSAAEPTPEQQAAIRQIEGPYAPFMDATVVIRNGGHLGSGFLVSKSGYIVTNHHVIEGASRVTVEKRDGSIAFGTVMLSDPNRDIAIVKIAAGDHKFMTMGHITDVQLGGPLFVIGAPMGLEYSLSKGSVSAIRSKGMNGANPVLVIQTDATINSGNSGGPILSDETGLVVAVSAFGMFVDEATNLNFGIAIDEVWNLLAESGLTLE